MRRAQVTQGADLGGQYAAALAAASMLFQAADSTYAAKLLDAAKRSYTFAEGSQGAKCAPCLLPWQAGWCRRSACASQTRLLNFLLWQIMLGHPRAIHLREKGTSMHMASMTAMVLQAGTHARTLCGVWRCSMAPRALWMTRRGAPCGCTRPPRTRHGWTRCCLDHVAVPVSLRDMRLA